VNCGGLVWHGGKLAGVISAIRRSDFSYAESRIGPLFHQVRFHAITDRHGVEISMPQNRAKNILCTVHILYYLRKRNGFAIIII